MTDSKTLPPGQQLVARGKWPVIGERRPRDDDSPWSLNVDGLVARALNLSLADLRGFTWHERLVDIHCVTRWSKLAARFGGVLLADVIEAAGARPQAIFVSFVARSERLHSTSLRFDEALAAETLLALEYEGAPLPVEHGGPLRVVVPGRYFYKSLKWLQRIDLLAEDQLGYWEREAGYHNEADPWREQRYIAARLTRQQAAAVLAGRDFSGLDLLSLDASGRDLSGLVARDALLRNADFSECRLSGAAFDRANLSNAHFCGADLRQASFQDADVEGADFRGAALRGVDFRGASLVGVTLFDEYANSEKDRRAAMLDASTRIDAAALEQLTPRQAEFVTRRLQATATDRRDAGS